MKQKVIFGILGGLMILSVGGIIGIVVREAMRTPADRFELAQEAFRQNNNRQGLRYLTRAADDGLPAAQYALALLYNVGDKIPENRELAKHYMLQAAAGDMPAAHHALGVWYEQGYFGSGHLPQAIQHYERAAELGHLNAMKSLVVIYGDMVANPERQAYWMNEINHRKEQ